MVTTNDLIDSLAANVEPVRRLRPPLVRCACWLMFAAFIVSMLAVSFGFRPGLAQRFADPIFAIRVSAALATGILASVSAFMISLPDRSGRWLLLPVPAIVVWFSVIGYGCLTDWVDLDPNGIRLGGTASCFATLVLTSAPLSFAMHLMMRHVGPLRPGAVTFCGAVAVAAITATALSLFHRLDATLLVIVWNIGVAVVFISLGSIFGKKLYAYGVPY